MSFGWIGDLDVLSASRGLSIPLCPRNLQSSCFIYRVILKIEKELIEVMYVVNHCIL